MKKSPQTAAASRKTKRTAAPPARRDESAAAATVEQLARFYHDVDAALFSLTVGPGRQFHLFSANECFLGAAGLEGAAVIGRCLEQIIPKAACTRVLKHCREAIRTRQTVRWDETYTHPSGVKYGKISVTPVTDAKGRVTHLSGSVQDITQHRNSEAALHESEERYRRIVQTAEEGIWTIDADSLTDYVNPKMTRMMGCTAEEMIGRPISDFLDDEGKALLTAHIRNRKSGISDQFEFKYLRKDGTPLWAFVSTNPITNGQGDYVGAMALLTDTSARRAAEDAMLESNAQFRAIFEQAAVGVALIDSNSGRFLNVNQRACDIVRLTRAQMMATTFRHIAHPEDLQSKMEHMKKLRDGSIQTFTMEKRCLNGDGSVTWISLTVSPLWKKGEAPSRHIAIMQDITERKQVEQSLARTTDLLERTGEMARIGGWELDVATQKLFWTLETCRLFEIETNEAPSLEQAILFYAPESQLAIRKAVSKAISHGTAYELELLAVTTKGRHFWARSQGSAIRKDGKTIKLVGTFQDITAHKKAEQDLIESEVRFRAVFEQAVVGVGLVDITTGRFIDVNRRYCIITGRSRKEMLKMTSDEMIHPDDRVRNRRMHSQLKSARSSEFQLEKRYVRPDGSVVWVNLNASLLSTMSGRPNQLLAMVEDITSRKLAEANFRREQAFNEILASHTSAIIILLDQHGHLIHANEATLQMLGYRQKDLVGKPPPWESDFMDAAEKVRSQKRFKEMLAGKNIPSREVTLIGKDGRRHVVALSSIITKTPEGTVDRIIVTGTDLTERNRLQKEILKISEQEQARIGHNLHDGVGQTMTGVATLIGALADELTGAQHESAARIHHLMQDAIQEVRHMSHSMSPASVKNRGLGGALHLLAETIRTNHRTTCTCAVNPDIKIDDQEKETHIYRIAQEAANNALRHGHPASIHLSLQRLGKSEAVLKIEDDGSGLGKRPHQHAGIGLRVMDYRANLIDGSLKIQSLKTGGVSVTCRFPYGGNGQA
ncbi:PAS domain S-box protein [Prosthecobacter sp.]|uniref:PAS domain S-box protein n=1 Tax=Prosthecobacter sp. TaxID=1965333 RepID=UPI0037844A84